MGWNPNHKSAAKFAREKGDYAVQKASELTQRVDEAIAAGTEDLEVKDARGGHVNLKARLDETTSQLAQIAINVKSFGAKGDGVTDDTSAINQAIEHAYNNGYSEVYFPSGIYLVNGAIGNNQYHGQNGALKMKSNIILTLSDNAVIQQAPTDFNSYVIVNFANVENAGIKGGTIIGDRYSHTGIGGEWGYGIGVFSSRNIFIENVTVKECWGDGINLKTAHSDIIGNVSKEEKQNKKIRLSNVSSTDNRRQGVSVESGVDVVLDKCNFSNTNGVSPKCGVDLEPASQNEYVHNITFSQCQFDNNEEKGLLIDGRRGEVKGVYLFNCSFKDNLSLEGNISVNGGENIQLNNVKVENGNIRLQSAKHVLLNTITSNYGLLFVSCEDALVSNSSFVRETNQASIITITDLNGVLSKDITFYNVKASTKGLTNTVNLFAFMRGKNTKLISCNFSNSRSLGVIAGESTLEMHDTIVSDMSVEGLLIEGDAKALLKNNTFDGICFNNNGQYIIRLRGNGDLVLSNNDFYKSKVFGEDKGEGRPIKIIRAESGTLRGHSNYTDGMGESVLETVNSDGYIAMTPNS